MAKISGLGVRLYVAGRDLSGDANALSDLRTSAELLDVSALEHEATVRLAGREDGHVTVNAWFDPDSGHQHDAWVDADTGALRRTDVHVLIPVGVNGAPAVGDPAAMLVAKQASYNVQTGPGSAIQASADFEANGVGLEWGVMLTAGKIVHASADEAASIDGGAESAGGASAMVHVFDVASGEVEPVVQDSADDNTFAAIDGLEFDGVQPTDGPRAQRLATSRTATIRRYVRFATTGTFGDAVVAAAFRRY